MDFKFKNNAIYRGHFTVFSFFAFCYLPEYINLLLEQKLMTRRSEKENMSVLFNLTERGMKNEE